MSLFINSKVHLPSSCEKCPFNFADMSVGICTAADKTIDTRTYGRKRHPDCPLVDIPTPRGRLIDADELLKVIEENSYRLRSVINSTENGMFLSGIRQAIDESPTIIEAENSSAIDDDVKKYCDYLKSETYDFCNQIENGEVRE